MPVAQATLLDELAPLLARGNRDEAMARLQLALAKQPQMPEAWYQLGELLKQQGQYSDALAAFDAAIAHGLARAEEAHLHRAILFSDHLRRDDDAEEALQTALALAPDYVPALLNLGNLHEERGQRELAMRCYQRVLEGTREDPRQSELRPEALSRSVNMQPPTRSDDPRLQQLRDASMQPAPPVVRANLLYALGRACDRLGEHAEAFDAWGRANRQLLRSTGRRWSREWLEQLVDGIIQAFPATLPPPAAREHPSPQPLLICGMFRSGSTLLEQVLSCHSQVTAGGELPWLLRTASTELAPWPASMRQVDAGRETVLGARYVQYLRELFPEAFDGSQRYISDKRPDNFLLLGMVQRLLPGTRIIHTRRDPLDTGLSMFMHHLNPAVAGYALDLGDIGHYYGQYLRLMAHWRQAFGSLILDFDYERFVSDPEPELRRLLQFLDLPWDDACLRFHEIGGTVKTASYWQIREPLNTRGSGRWRHYRRQLQPMIDAMRNAEVPIAPD